MAYEEELADRIRELVGGQPELSEQKMFGGLAFLINGNMAVVASGRGGLMVRVDPVEGEKLVSTSAAEPMEMRGRESTGGGGAGRRDASASNRRLVSRRRLRSKRN